MALLPPPRRQAGSGPRLNTSLTPEQRDRLLRELAAARLGRPVPKEKDGGHLPFVPDIVDDAVSQIATALIQSVPGMFHVVKGVTQDAMDVGRYGDITPERTAGLGADIVRSVANDFRHPRENIGYLLMDLFGMGSSLARAPGRVSRARQNLSALKAPGDGPPPPLLPPGAPVPLGGGPPPSLPPSPGETARAAAETVRTTTPFKFTPEEASRPPLLTKHWQERLPGLPAEAFRFEAPPRTMVEPELPPVHPLQRTLFSDVAPEKMPPIGAQMQIPGALETSAFPSLTGRLPKLPDRDPRPTPAVKPDGTPMNLPPTIEDLAAQTAAKGQLVPRAVPEVDEFGEPIKAKHTPASSIVRIYADRKTKRLEIDEKDTALNMRPVRDEGKTRWQLFDGDQPLVPVVQGYKAAKDVLGEAYLARKGNAEDTPLLEKAQDAPAADPMAALMAAVDKAAMPKEKSKTVGSGRFKAKLVPGQGWSVVDTTKKGSQFKMYPFAAAAEVSKAAERHAKLEKDVAKLAEKPKKTKAETARLEEMQVILEQSKRDLGEQDAQALARAHADRLNTAHDLRERGIAPGSEIYEDYTNERLYRFKNGIPDDEPIPPLAERIAEAEEQVRINEQYGKRPFSRENGPKKPKAASNFPSELKSAVPGISIMRVAKGEEYRSFDDYHVLEDATFKTKDGKDGETVVYQAWDEDGEVVGSIVMHDLGDSLDVGTVVLDKGVDARVLRDLLAPVLNSTKPVTGDALNERWLPVLKKAAKKNPNLRSLADHNGRKIGDLLDSERPKVKPVAAKPEKPTPRELGRDSRTQELNPRALGVSQRQLEEYGLDKAQAKEITSRIAPAVRKVWQDAIAKGKDKPTRKEIHQVLVDHVGEDLAKKITTRMMKVKGGAPITARMVVREVLRALPDPARSFDLSRTVMKEETSTVGPKAGFPKGKMGSPSGSTIVTRKATKETVKVPLSRNPLVAGAQRTILRSYEKYPDLRIPGLRRDLDSRFDFEMREINRIGDLLEKVLPAHHQEKLRQAVRDAAKKPINKEAGIGGAVDSFNQASKIGLLFLKPAYVPANLLGQIAITLADHSFNPVNLARSWKLSSDIARGKATPELQKLKRKLDDAMQQGFVDAVAYEKGAIRPISVVYERAADRFSSILDTPFRRATFFHEARRQGYDTPEKIAKLLDAKKGTAEWNKLIDVSRRANRNIIDYGRMGPNEKRFIRRIVFFYPWFKGATLYGAHFLSEHTVQGTALIHEGKMAEERQEKELGPLPSYLDGVFKVGETNVPGLGKMPKVINPQAASVLGTPGEALNFARALIGGGTREADQPSSFLTPALTAAIAGFTRQDPFTGRDYPADASFGGIVYNELKKTVAPVRLKQNLDKAEKIDKGELDPREVLFPGGQGEALGRFIGGTTPITLNTREAQSRAFAEGRTLQSKRQREVSRHAGYRTLYLEKARSVGLVPKDSNLPKHVRDAFSARAQRYANRAALEEELDRDLRPVDRLRSDLDLLVRQKKMPEATAQTILLSLAQYDDGTITSFLRDLGDRYFMSQTLSAFRAALNARGAEVTVP